MFIENWRLKNFSSLLFVVTFWRMQYLVFIWEILSLRIFTSLKREFSKGKKIIFLHKNIPKKNFEQISWNLSSSQNEENIRTGRGIFLQFFFLPQRNSFLNIWLQKISTLNIGLLPQIHNIFLLLQKGLRIFQI